LPEAVAWIASRVDVLWAPVDSTVFNSQSASFVLQQMLLRKVPVVGFSENMVKAGALLATRVGYVAVGRQTAGLLQKLLAGRVPPGATLEAPGQFELVANGRVNKLLSNPIADAARSRVSFIRED
jgi:ABC-type uncharacterized transport system substrate-binding protein